MRRTLPAVVATVGLLLLTGLTPGLVTDLEAQGHPHEREGWWFTGGLGMGWMGTEGLDSREDGFSGQFAVGTTRSDRLLLGVTTAGWTYDPNEIVSVYLLTLGITARFYPNPESGLYLNGIGGLGQTMVTGFGDTDREFGVSVGAGVGFDYRFNPEWSLSPFINGLGYQIDGEWADVLQVGLAITRH